MKKSLHIASLSLSLCAAAVLVACGGGDSSSSPPSSSTYSIAGSSAAVATSLGASDIAVSGADTAAIAGATDALDMTAAVGDTWRLVLNANTSKFKLIPVASSYGLNTTSNEGTFTKTVSGTIETYEGNFGTPGQANGGTVKGSFDTRTKSLIGKVTWHNGTENIESVVTGTKMALGTSITGLAGNYVFANMARNQSNGQFQSSTAGMLNVAADGLVKLCPGMKYDATSAKCVKLDGTTPNDGTQDPITLQLTANSGGNLSLAPTGGGMKTLVLGGGKTSIAAHVEAGDLGPVLVIDQDWENDSNIRRTGIFVAARIPSIEASKFSGDFYCPTISVNGVTGGTLRVTPTSFNVVGGNQSVTIALNKVWDTGSSVERNFAGGFHMFDGVRHQFGFQLSSSLFVFQAGDETRLNFCQRT